MIRFEMGDIVRVAFPHVERDVHRYRPALVVTDEPIGPDGLLIWVAMITSAERARWPGDIPITDHQAVGLPIASVIRTAKLTTLEAAAAEPLGRLSQSQIGEVQAQLRNHLGLN